MSVHLANYLLDFASPSASRGNGPIFTCLGTTITAVEARSQVLNLVRLLSAYIGMSIGDRICTLAQSTPSHLTALLAITAAGCIAAPLNWRWSAREVEYAINHIQASVLCADSSCLSLALEVMARCRYLKALIIVGDIDTNSRNLLVEAKKNRVKCIHAEESLKRTPDSSFPPPTILVKKPADDAAFIMFTSGTTGPPRAAVLSHTALHFQCGAKLRYCGYSVTDTYLHAAQFFHIGGLCSALAMLRAGALHVFMPIFRPKECIDIVIKHKITSFIVVPTMIADLVAAAGQNTGAVPSVQSILIGAGGLSPPLLSSLTTLFPSADLHSAYGMTEACSSITFQRLSNVSNSASSPNIPNGAMCVGAPPIGIELAILPISTANSASSTFMQSSVLQSSGYGEVLTRGPHLMLRYWDDSSSTAFLPGGWFRTGDLGYLEDSSTLYQVLWLVGRAKDVIKSGGENVPAAEVERAMLQHPSVAAVAVVGLADTRLGERVAAAIVLNPQWNWMGPRFQVIGSSSSLATEMPLPPNEKVVGGALLQQHCRSLGLAGFKLPRTVVYVDSLPTNATGKVAKAQVKELLMQQHSSGALRARL